MNYYAIIYKPFQVLSQFASQEEKQTLADYFHVPKDVYPVGRLDYDSEGLLLLTNDSAINHRLLHPSFKHTRSYWVQVEGAIDTEATDQLERGVEISIDGKLYKTQRCKATILPNEPMVEARNPPIRFRKNIPTSWLSLTLTEGKNRQVRRMTAKVGYPTLRLIRYSIEQLSIDGMRSGDLKVLTKNELVRNLFGGATF